MCLFFKSKIYALGPLKKKFNLNFFFFKHYDSLTKDKKVNTRMTVNRTDTAFVRREALGVVLIICKFYQIKPL